MGFYEPLLDRRNWYAARKVVMNTDLFTIIGFGEVLTTNTLKGFIFPVELDRESKQ